MSLEVMKLGIIQNQAFKFTISTTENNESFILPLAEYDMYGNLNTYDFTISWGDGSVSTITSFDDEDINHNYVVAGTYTVSMKGTCTYFVFDSSNSTQAAKFKRIWNIYDMGFIQIAFEGCVNLTHVSDNFRRLKHLQIFHYLFKDCTALTSIPPGILDGCSLPYSSMQMFQNCTSLTSIPNDLFKYCTGLQYIYWTFSGCTGLTNIPEDLFKYNANLQSILYIFEYCTGLICTIPEDLFTYNLNLYSLYGVFTGCTNLTGTIPEDLFANNVLLSECGSMFAECNSLTGSIPELLFFNNNAITNLYGMFTDCTGLTGSIPANLFRYMPLVEDVTYTFEGCTGLTGEIPSDLLYYNPNIINVFGLFKGCSSLTGSIPAELFVSQELLIWPYEIFYDCSGLTGEIPEELFYTCINALDFVGTFEGCSGLTGTIPGNLFRYNTVARSFYYTFKGCSSLDFVADGLFKYNTQVTEFVATFQNCINLHYTKYMFYDEGGQATRFFNQSVNFRYCFYRDSFTGNEESNTYYSYPDLWNCDWGDGTPIYHYEGNEDWPFGGYGNNLWVSGAYNGNQIPEDWGGSDGYFRFKIKTTEDNETFTLPLVSGGFHYMEANWGDEESNFITGFNSVNKTHTYAKAGMHTISLYGTCSKFAFNNAGDKLKLIKVFDFYDMGFDTLNFYGCSNLTYVPRSMYRLEYLTTAVNMFRGCSSLVSPDFAIFQGSQGITSFAACFMGCSSMKTIPAGIFDNQHVNVTSFAYTFASCIQIEEIPVNLFYYNTNAAFFNYTFAYCAGLRTIPGNLFDTNVNAIAFNYVFNTAINLETIPEELFRYNTEVQSFANALAKCTKLQLNEHIFWADGERDTRFLNKTVDFTNCFQRTSFEGTQGIVPDLWNCDFGSGYIPVKTNCFDGAGNSLDSISNYESIPEEWK